MKFLSRLWRNKGRVRLIFYSLLVASFLFIIYQFAYYNTITDYQSEEVKSKVLSNKKSKDSLSKTAAQLNKEVVTPGIAQAVVEKNSKFERLIGVAPDQQKFYDRSVRQLFSCIRSKRKIAWSKVNDDFCDCPADGSDEPSTAACMNGRFYCTKQSQGYPEYIPSSRVNDNVCDCCDGSDEYERFWGSSCKNNCA